MTSARTNPVPIEPLVVPATVVASLVVPETAVVPETVLSLVLVVGPASGDVVGPVVVVVEGLTLSLNLQTELATSLNRLLLSMQTLLLHVQSPLHHDAPFPCGQAAQL